MSRIFIDGIGKILENRVAFHDIQQIV